MLSWPESTKKALVSNKNIILYYHYLNDMGKKLSEKSSLGELLFKDKFEKNFFLDKDEWCELEDYIQIVRNAIRLSENFETPKLVGALLPKYQKEYKLSEITVPLTSGLKAAVRGPMEIYKYISFFNYLFNKTKDMEFLSGGNGFSMIKIKFRQGVDPVYDFLSEMHIEGIFRSVMDIFGLSQADIYSPFKEYDLEKLIKHQFPGFYSKLYISGNKLYLGSRQIAQRADIDKEMKDFGNKYSIKFDRYLSGEDFPGWKIVKDVYYEKRHRVFKKGEVYNAPFFITMIEWDKINILNNIIKLAGTSLKDISPTGRNYPRIIQERMKQEQKKAALRYERQKLEKEFHDMLLRQYINPKFIRKAKLGIIPFKKILVTNVFMDIDNSTRSRQEFGDDEYRKNRSMLLSIIKNEIEKAGRGWGWINKVMGDGCYIVFGAYNYFNEDQDSAHAEEALDFISNVYKRIDEYGSNGNNGYFRNFYLRTGIESGEVELGEAYGKPDEFEDEIDLGSFRVFDTDGESVHRAKRIEEASKLLVDHMQRKNRSIILAGPEFQRIIQNTDNIKKIDLDSLNIKVRDFSDMDLLYEYVLQKNKKRAR